MRRIRALFLTFYTHITRAYRQDINTPPLNERDQQTSLIECSYMKRFSNCRHRNICALLRAINKDCGEQGSIAHSTSTPGQFHTQTHHVLIDLNCVASHLPQCPDVIRYR